MSTGLLRITLKKAELTHNCKLLRKMDPYVNFKYKGEKQASAVCNDGHMKPVWQDQTFEFRLDAYCKNIFIQVKDKDLLKAPLIGEADLHVDDLIKKGGVFEWFNLKYKEKSAGKIKLETKFIENNAAPN